MEQEKKRLQVEVLGDVMEEIKRLKDGRIDWNDYMDQIWMSLEGGDPDRAEALLSQEHPVIRHEELMLERLNEVMQEKYGRDSYLSLDPEKDNKHVISKSEK